MFLIFFIFNFKKTVLNTILKYQQMIKNEFILYTRVIIISHLNNNFILTEFPRIEGCIN